MKKLLIGIVLLPLVAIAADLNIQSLTRLHLSHHHSTRWSYFRGIDDEWMDSNEELRNFKINEKSDTVYIFYYDAFINYTANILVWNSGDAIRLRNGIIQRPWKDGSITPWYRNMIECWDTTMMRTLAGKYNWEKLGYHVHDSYPNEAYVSRIIINNGKLTIDTIEYYDPTQNGTLKEELDVKIEKLNNPEE